MLGTTVAPTATDAGAARPTTTNRRLAWTRAYRLAVACALLPVAMMVAPADIRFAPGDLGRIVHFAVMKSSYDRHVAQLGPDRDRRLPEFNRGGMSWSSDGVVYDESDEIMLPKRRRSAAWQAREKDTDVMCGGDDLVGMPQPLWAHYDLVAFGC